MPCDDSVVRIIDGQELPIRRSRGYAPLPIDLGLDGPAGPAVLAVGGELKNTFCLTDGSRAYLSGHIGDMATWRRCARSSAQSDQLSEIRGKPMRLAADLHPGYHTRSWAERHTGDRPLDLVQHHHAHVVSLLAEHGRIGEPIIGVSFDGTGYGCDHTIWGGEVLTLGPDSHRFVRAGHLLAVPLPGGDKRSAQPLADGAVPVVDGRYRLDVESGTRRRGNTKRIAAHSFAIGERHWMRAVLKHGPAVRRCRLSTGGSASDRLRGPGRHRTRGAR